MAKKDRFGIRVQSAPPKDRFGIRTTAEEKPEEKQIEILDADKFISDEMFVATQDAIKQDANIEAKQYVTEEVINNWIPVGQATEDGQLPENVVKKTVKSATGNVDAVVGDEVLFNQDTGNKVVQVGGMLYESPGPAEYVDRPPAGDYIAQSVATNALIPKLAARLMGKGDELEGYEITYEDDAEGKFTEVRNLQQTLYELSEARDPSLVEEVGAFTVAMLTDTPLFGVFGKAGGLAYKGLGKSAQALKTSSVGNFVATKLSKAGLTPTQVSARMQGVMEKLGTAASQSGGALGGYNVAADIETQLEQGKSMEEIDYAQTLNSGGHGLALGSATAPLALSSKYANKLFANKINSKLSGATGKIAEKGTALTLATTSLGAEAGLFAYGGAALAGEEMPSVSDYLKTVAEFGALKLSHAGRKGFKPKVKAEDIQFTPLEIESTGFKSKEGLLSAVETGTADAVLKDKNIPYSAKKKVAAYLGIDAEVDPTPYEFVAKEKDGKSTVEAYDKNGTLLEVVSADNYSEAVTVATLGSKSVDMRETYRKFNALDPAIKMNVPEELVGKLTELQEKPVDRFTQEDWNNINELNKFANENFTVKDVRNTRWNAFPEQKEQLDFLKERGVDVSNDTKVDKLGKLYETEKEKSIQERETIEAKPEEKLTETKPEPTIKEEVKEPEVGEKLPKKETVTEEGVQKIETIEIKEETKDAEKITPETDVRGEQERAEGRAEERLRVRDIEQDRKGEAVEQEKKGEPSPVKRKPIPPDVLKQANESFQASRKNLSDADAALETWKTIERSDWYQKQGSKKRKRTKEYFFNEVVERYTETPSKPKQALATSIRNIDRELNKQTDKVFKKKAKEIIKDAKVSLEEGNITQEQYNALAEQFLNATDKAKRNRALEAADKIIKIKEGVALRSQLRMEARAAREAKRFTDIQFKETSDAMRTQLKEARDAKHITPGQYRSMIRKLGMATTENRREKALTYVDKVLEGSEYKGQLKKANAELKKISDANKEAKSKFGTAKPLVDELVNVDIRDLTLEELTEFNRQVPKIMKSRKAPEASTVEALVSRFGDRQKEVVKSEKISTNAELTEFVDNLQEKDIASVRDYMSISRQTEMAKNKAHELLENGLITDLEFESVMEKLSGDVTNKTMEAKLDEYKSVYSEEVSTKAKELYKSNELDGLPRPIQIKLLEMLYEATPEAVKKLGITDIEALDVSVDNLNAGFRMPVLAELRRKLEANKIMDSTISPSLQRLSNSKVFQKLWKSEFKRKPEKAARALSTIGRYLTFRKKKESREAGENLKRLLQSTQKHAIGLKLGDMRDRGTISEETYEKISSGLEQEVNEKNKYEKKRTIIIKNLEKGIKGSMEERQKIINKLGLLLKERSWQSEDKFKKGEVNKNTASINDQTYTSENYESLTLKRPKFEKESIEWEAIKQEAKDKGFTKKVNGVEVVDTEAFIADMRKNKVFDNFFKEYDTYMAELKPIIEWAAYENGFTFGEKENYFSFQKVGTGKEVEAPNIKESVESAAAKPKMRAGATQWRKGKIEWFNADVFEVMETYTNETLRNYYVYPEAKIALSALKEAGKIQKGENIAKFGTSKDIQMLTKLIAEDVQDVMQRHYNSGRYAYQDTKGFDHLMKAATKGLLAKPAKAMAEIPANMLRAFPVVQGIKLKTAAKAETRTIYDSIMDGYMSDRYFSKYAAEVGDRAYKSKLFRKAEEGADFLITVSDRLIGKPMFVDQFNKEFTRLTGKNFDAKAYGSNIRYVVENRDAISKSAKFGMKRLQELFNDKSALTTPQLNTFFGGMVKLDSRKPFSRLFNMVQSFNRNEVNHLVRSSKRISNGLKTGDVDQMKMGVYDMASMLTSNTMYGILRAATGLSMKALWAYIFDKEMTPWEKEQAKSLLDVKEADKHLYRALYGFASGGTGIWYANIGKWGYLVADSSGILNDEQKEILHTGLQDIMYTTPISKYGSLKKQVGSVMPMKVWSDDMIEGVEGLSATIAMMNNMYENGDITQEQLTEFLNTVNIGVKYFAPNPVSPMLDEILNRFRYNIKESGSEELKKEVFSLEALEKKDKREPSTKKMYSLEPKKDKKGKTKKEIFSID